jgi:hypothetical protein
VRRCGGRRDLCILEGCLSGSGDYFAVIGKDHMEAGVIDTSTSSSSTTGDRWFELGMDRYREDRRGSVANMSSLRVSSRGSAISGSVAWSI